MIPKPGTIRPILGTLTAAGLIFISGCSAISQLPTVQHCHYVKYERDGTKVDFTMKCIMPVGGVGGWL